MTMVLSIYILGAFFYFLIRLIISDITYHEDGLPPVTKWLCFGVMWPLFLLTSIAEHFGEALSELRYRLSNLFRR